MQQPLIEFKDVGIDFDGARKLAHITFSVDRGEFVIFHGSTGSGKTVVLNLIASLLLPSTGEIRVAGERTNGFSARKRLWLRRLMGLMVQNGLLLEDRSILENVMLPALAAEESSREARQRALSALGKCGISALARLRPVELSAGQRQLACLARAVVNRPVVILADEPAAHLDAENAQILMNLFGEFALAGVTVVVASHLQLQPENIKCRSIHLDAENDEQGTL